MKTMAFLADKVTEILRAYPICDSCLGRQFSLLGTQTTNAQRGYSLKLYLTMQMHLEAQDLDESKKTQAIETLKVISEKGNHLPAMEVLRKILPDAKLHEEPAEGQKFKCYLCDNIFSQVREIAEIAYEKGKDFEFDNFLVGTALLPEISDREDELRAKFQLTQGEAFKSHINREVGKILQKQFNVPVEFKEPQLLFRFDLGFSKLEISAQANPLFIAGKYKKFERGIPQTHWPCTQCGGKGCPRCNNLGKMYPTSVEELVSSEIRDAAQGTETKFHGAGREDIDARCLGNGRPYVLEVKNPRRRHFDLRAVEDLINKNAGGKVSVSELQFSTKEYMQELKTGAEYRSKKYFALCQMEPGISKVTFEQKLKEVREKITIIVQRTPMRVVHRRADLSREKRVLKITGEWRDDQTAAFTIEAQGGTYIKELISGDGGRTRPNISEIFGVQITCTELDIINVDEISSCGKVREVPENQKK
ncbi:MAG: hypothetical protein RBG13Loki_3475 [Promethearchaeota archaeon CR_4]|nr:MAG: hypothetical protein RBG13Loki_3475 [Candidatus Lokiarchaeota archaeon CR_4]